MGSSKKHKKDSKKRKHRSRSRSPLSPVSDTRDKDRRHHKKHKERKRERSPDVEEVPVDSHLQPAPAASAPTRSGESLSVEETNRLRAKLGLKPLQVNDDTPNEDGKITDDLGEFYHKPAENLAQKKQQEKIRTKISERKQKRLVESKLLTVRALGDEEDEGEGGAAEWVQKNRELTRQKQEAAKRAAILDELDAEFGVGALAVEEERSQRGHAYGAQHLRGLHVAHSCDTLPEGHTLVLTLEDRGVLEEGDDTLVNVNLRDQEKYDRSNQNKKQSKSGYTPYEGADNPELYGIEQEKQLLSKYDEEIFGEKKARGFTIGDDDQREMENFKKMMIREKLSHKRLESLVLPEPKLASEYYTEEELKAKFKKPRKKGKIRPKVKTEDTQEDIIKNGGLVTDDTEVKTESLSGLKEEEDEEQDNELEKALARTRSINIASRLKLALPKLEELVKQEPEEEEAGVGGIVLDSTAEFCRTLGDIPTYGQAGNRDVGAQELMELEEAASEEQGAGREGGAWSSVDPDMEHIPVDITRDGGGALEAEPRLDSGVGGALLLALSKGYLERGGDARPAPPALPHLQAHHYSIDDKAHGDDDKLSRRERGHAGPASEFREKEGFRPHVKLDYVDDEGRPLRPKEAFRYLSHKFHGKGPGKNKQEKRIKQGQQEGLMRKMNSTDTPLGTLALLQARQKEARAPFLVLSGAKRSAPL